MLPLRRITTYLNLLPIRPLSTCPPLSPPPLSHHDVSLAKIISTLFLLSPHLLTSLPYVITPTSALLSLLRLPYPHLLRLLLHRHVPLPPSSFRHVITHLLHSRQSSHALQLFDQMHQPNSDPLLLDSLLNYCINSGDLDSALQFITRASQSQSKVLTYTFNKFLNLLNRSNRERDAIFLFRKHSRGVFVPDTCSYNEVVKGCCKMRDFDGAFGFFKEMREFGCCPDRVTFNLLIDGLCKGEEVDRGRQVLSRMRVDEGECRPNVVSYTAVVKGYCRAGRMDEAKRVFDEMVEVGIKPSAISYNVMIDGYGKVGEVGLAVEMYKRMRVCGCVPDIVTYTSLIDGYCRCGKVDDAMRIWGELGGRGTRPNVYTYDILIKSLCKMNRLSEALGLLKELDGRRDIVARAFVYNPVIDGLCKAGDVDEANSILGEMEKRGCRPDKFTYTILIIGHCMKGRMSEAIDLFDQMVVTGCPPDSITVHSLVSCLLKAGMPNEAKGMMSKSSGRELKLNVLPSKEIPPLLTKRTDVSVAV